MSASKKMESLRLLPPVNDILQSAALTKFQSVFRQPFFKRALSELLNEKRAEFKGSTAPASRAELTVAIADELSRRIELMLQPSLRRVINASGVILHTNLGRSPLPQPALEHLSKIASTYCNLEFDINRGERGKRDEHAERLIRQLLDCEAALVVNNNAAAVLLVLNSLAEGGSVIASRGEQVEIGGSFRIPEVMAKSGARLREVGTTNRTRIQDYEKAIDDSVRLLLRVHPSNFRMKGFTARPSLEEFVELGAKMHIPTFEDLGSGCMEPLDFMGVADEPLPVHSIQAGVDLICFSGDKLLGGPQAGVIAGKRIYIDRVRLNPLFRALRVDKLTMAALESVLLLYLKGAVNDIPIRRMLHASETQLRERAVAFKARLSSSIAEAIALNSVVGGGSAPEAFLPSWGLALRVEGLTETELEQRLRQASPPVIGKIEGGRVTLDFRTIFPEDEADLLTVLENLV